jgi:hypothetical protein
LLRIASLRRDTDTELKSRAFGGPPAGLLLRRFRPPDLRYTEAAIMKFKSALIAVMALFASTAWSADNGFYVGGGIGMSDVSAGPFSGTDFAYKLFVGYDIIKYLAVEGGYENGGTPNDLGVDISVDGWDVAVLGKWPVTEAFDIHARVGWEWWNADLRGGGEHFSDSGNDFLYGAGVGFMFGDHFGMTADWEHFSPSDADVNLYTVGAIYKF